MLLGWLRLIIPMASIADAAGSQHRIQDDHIPSGNIAGQLAVILHRLQGFRVPVKADMTYLAAGTKANTPSTMPKPARRIGIKAILRPAITFVVAGPMGVSIRAFSRGKSLVAS